MPYPSPEGTTLSRAILTTLRRLPQLKGSLKLTALELAHMASGSGTISVPYAWLARKTGMCVRTMQRHIDRLIALQILTKTCYRLALNRWGTNRYTFLVPGAPILHKCAPDILSPLSSTTEKKEKSLSLRDEIAQLERGIRLWTPGSDPYLSCQERLSYLHGLRSP